MLAFTELHPRKQVGMKALYNPPKAIVLPNL
jgi:hypothetical protein